MTLRYCTLDVFTDHPFGGNQLAVFCNAPDLPAEVMQSIARELNLSETVFIRKARDPRAAWALRIFTPYLELPFAGHPTIGAAHALVEEGLVDVSGPAGEFLLEEAVGLVPIKVTRRQDGAWFVQLTTARLPEAGPEAPSAVELAELLGLTEADILQGKDRAQFLSCGVPYLCVPLCSRRALGAICIDPTANRRLKERAGSASVYAFCYEPERSDSDIRARMFAQEFGIAEDPATGSAAAALAGYLGPRAKHRDATLRWTIEQGFEMGRPSLIYLEADRAEGLITRVRVGGTAVRMSEAALVAFQYDR